MRVTSLRCLGLAALTCLWVEAASAREPFGEDEHSEQVGGLTNFEGRIGALAYQYALNAEGHVVNGSIDGPATAPGWAMDDPDRWVLTVTYDQLDDSIEWRAIHYQTGLMMPLSTSGAIREICVIHADFPGRQIAVRVGAYAALQLPKNCSAVRAGQLQAQLMEGGRLLTRGYEWPHDYPTDKEGHADNFARLMTLFAYLKSIGR